MGKKTIAFFIINFLWLLLIPVFVLEHGYNEFFGLITSSKIYSLFVNYAGVVLVILVLSRLFLDKPTNVFFFAFFLLVLYFFFGVLHDFLKTALGKNFFTSYKFLLPSLLAIILMVFFYLKKRTVGFRLVNYVKSLFLLLLFLEIIVFIQKSFSGEKSKNDLLLRTEMKETTPLDKPDIFFIVFDEYASSRSLKGDLGFDNSLLDSSLVKNGFFLSAESKSNYNLTPFSLASTFGMNYLNIGNDTLISSKSLLQAVNSVKKNVLVPFLIRHGYQIKNFGCFDFDSFPCQQQPYFENYFSDVIDNQTFYSRIRKDIWWNIALKNFFTGKRRVPNSFIDNRKIYLKRNIINFQNLEKELNSEGTSPKFVYAHLMLPHEPFFIKGDGTLRSENEILWNEVNPREGYLGQIEYANQLIKQLLFLINSPKAKNRVVIIEGDHGYRFFAPNAPIEKCFMNLNAYFFSDKSFSALYKTISPVNTFRIILNKYFNQQLPLLKDSSTYLIDPQYDKRR